MKNNMELISYVDNLINLSIDQINFYKSNINQQQKKIYPKMIVYIMKILKLL